MKNMKKIVSILMIVMMLCTVVVPVLAKDVGGVTIDPNKNGTGNQGITNVGNNILGMIQIIGSIIAVGILMVLGIKYMMGSAEEKAEYKKTMIPYIIGAILLFAAVNIASAVVSMTTNITA